MKDINPLAIVEVALKASNIVMKCYNKEQFETKRKIDNSYVTSADIASSKSIISGLNKLHPDTPVVSEENDEAVNADIVRNSKKFWLIDPIDGTWSFVNRSGDFVINIALIDDGKPIFGVISAPLVKSTYYNDNAGKVYKLERNNLTEVRPNRQFNDGGYDFLISDINMNQRTQDFVASHQVKTLTPVPSAYKFALMVEGKGDIYPRFKPTYIWDTAAGHALLLATGGEIYDATAYKPLVYNGNLKNPNFVATVDTKIKLVMGR